MVKHLTVREETLEERSLYTGVVLDTKGNYVIMEYLDGREEKLKYHNLELVL